MAELAPGALTDVAGIEVGHAQDPVGLTGCTVALCREGAVGGVAVRGLAPGTRETDLLRPGTLVERAHAILLTGGSAFGLAAADGVMRYLEEQGVGYDTGVAKVPIVPGAVLFDLGLGDPRARPDAAMGYAACQAACSPNRQQGNVGAGMGATVGKLFGVARACKGGLGTASVQAGRLTVAALIAVNAFGDVRDPATGRIIAGTRQLLGRGWADTAQAIVAQGLAAKLALRNTVIGVVATDARLDAAQAHQLASVAHDGLARTISPAHTLYDGDTLFALATGRVEAAFLLLQTLAVQAVERAVLNAIWAAEGAGGLPAARDLPGDG